MTYSDPSQRAFDGTYSINRWAYLVTGVTLLAFVALAVLTAPCASAVSDTEELTRFGGIGEGAGQLKLPAGVATDPVTGHVYTAESGANNRISEFTPWGNFVKAFGWDVAPGTVNEQQEVRVRAAEGQFKLSFGASTTPDLAFDAPGSESEGPESVEAALNALPSIGGAGGEVNVNPVPGTPDGKTPFIYVVAFKGALAGTNVSQLTTTNGTTPLSGGVPSSGLEARTRVDGTVGGTGLEPCTAESGCKAGLEGGGAGEFASASGLAVDANGNVYVREVSNHRMQKFDSAGRFVLTAGGEVNETKSAEGGSSQAERNLCTKASGDQCGIGIVGNGPGQFGEGFSDGITLCSGTLFVADKERIQRFNLEGEFQAELPEPGKTVRGVACDPASGDLYATFEPEPGVQKLDSTTGEEIDEFEGGGALTTDPAGNVYTVGLVQGLTGKEEAVLQFDSSRKPLSPPSCCGPESPFRIGGLGTNSIGNLYAAYAFPGIDSFIRAFGPAPVSFEAPPKMPPSITAQFATSVDRSGATVAAEINPHFWTNTRYYVEYGTGKCSEGGCEETKPVPPGSILSPKVVDAPLRSAGIFLEGLKPGTTYHYRFVAQSSGGGPVHGIGGEVGADGEESTFTTYPIPTSSKVDCPNQAFRTGFSAPLPDCRAFEMVSPIDKNNGDIKALLDFTSYTTALSQSAVDGSRFTYSSYRGFGDPQAAPYINQYLATREDSVGWSSEALEPTQASHFNANAFENHFKAFSADLCKSWLMVAAEPVLAPGATAGYNDLYRRDSCGEEGYEALIQVEPSEKKFFPLLQGTSANSKVAIFMARENLTPGAADGLFQTYYASKGELHLICIGLNGSPSGGNCSGGMGAELAGQPEFERRSSLTHAISVDGSKVYWTDSGDKEAGPGKIYLRLNPGEEQSEISGGECTEAEKACTLKVSQTISSKASRFLAASASGTEALFEIPEDPLTDIPSKLYKFDVETGSSTLIAGKSLGVAGASEDLSHVYFVSEEALPETTGATAGKPNLYLAQEGTKTFIATLSEGDRANTNFEAIYHAARATADGRVLAFISAGRLTGYDNTDLASGKADTEVYLYETGEMAPVCVSCNPSGARPLGRLVSDPHASGDMPTAGSLAMPENALYSPRVLSANGERLFFSSFDSLLPRDTNDRGDVYEWEAAGSTEDCKEKGGELYVPSSGGCLSLISSGQSPSDSEFLDMSANGDDAFFITNSSLVPQDPGLIDVYDTRANGGLPAPPQSPGPCQGEACQFAPPPPNDPTPASVSFKGVGNLKLRSRCAKNKVVRRGRCVAKKRKQAKKRHSKRNANNNRRQAR